MAVHVLITGGAGYLGSVMSEQMLDRGYTVTIVDNLMYHQTSLYHLFANQNFNFVYGDVRDERLMASLVRQADIIVPLAAIVGAPACDRDPWLARQVNLEAIQLIMRLRSPGQLVVFPCTNSGYGTQTGDVYCTEDTPMEPISLYGRLKVEAEKEVLDGTNTITLRLATVFGTSPRQRLDLLVNSLVYAAVTEGYITIFEGHFKRNFVHIRDVADCFVFCAENSEPMVGRPYNLGLDAANISKSELALKIKEHVPGLYIHHAEVGSDPDRRNYIVSNQRLRDAGFEARHSLDEGIRELIGAYRMLVGAGPMRNA